MCSKLEVGLGPIVICEPNTEGPYSLIAVTILVMGCNAPVFKEYPEAIKFAIENAVEGDCVLVLGKGHETGQEIKGKITPFDDRVELKNAIKSARSAK